MRLSHRSRGLVIAALVLGLALLLLGVVAWARAVSPGIEPQRPAMPGPPGPPDVRPPEAPRVVRATVTAVEGLLAVDLGALCAFPVDPRERPDGTTWCNAQVVCGGELLYGGPDRGHFPCELLDTPRRGVRGGDDATHALDGDAAIRLDTLEARLEVYDDATGEHGAFRVVARVDAVE